MALAACTPISWDLQNDHYASCGDTERGWSWWGLPDVCQYPASSRETFFKSGSWSGLADWKQEMDPHYTEAERMLGATENQGLYDSDEALRAVAGKFGKSLLFEPTRVAVFFGEPEQEVADPYFNGEGPRRSGCNHCGACMTGCRYNAKNTLDKNYLYLAEKGGAEVFPEKKVVRIRPMKNEKEADADTGESGYRVAIKSSYGLIKQKNELTARAIILSGGVLGTVRLLLNMKRRYLSGISEQLGAQIRTNNESLALVHSRQKEKDFSRGVAIGSIFHPIRILTWNLSAREVDPDSGNCWVFP